MSDTEVKGNHYAETRYSWEAERIGIELVKEAEKVSNGYSLKGRSPHVYGVRWGEYGQGAWRVSLPLTYDTGGRLDITQTRKKIRDVCRRLERQGDITSTWAVEDY